MKGACELTEASPDEDDFDALCAREHAPLVGALTLWCGDGSVAEEVVQEAFARAYRDWSRIRRLDVPSAWVRRVAMNLARSRFRRWQAERRARARLHRAPETAPDHADVVTVRDAVGQLPPGQRTAVILRYFLDLSTRETADLMQRSETAVTSLTSRAISGLRAELGASSEQGRGDDHE